MRMTRTVARVIAAFASALMLAACGGGGQPAVTSTVTVSATATSASASVIVPTTTTAPTSASADEVNRVINTRGDVVCLMFQTMGMNQDTLDEVAHYVMTTPAIKLSKLQGQQVIRGSVETYCPEFSQQIAEVFG